MRKDQPRSDHALAGAISGLVTRFVCQPLDVVKIRFQLQVEPIKPYHYSKYRSVPQALLLICKEEGLCALWKGLIPAQLLSITYGACQFYSYQLIMELLKLSALSEWKNSGHLMAGAGAGLFATIVSYPFDLLRTRLVAQSEHNVIYRSLPHSFSYIMRHETPKAFFYGLSPALLQIVPYAGLQFFFYEKFTKFYKNCFFEDRLSTYNTLMSGSSAGLLAKTIVYPADLARKRLQIQGFEQARYGFGEFFRCKGLYDCFRATIMKEGIQGLFKGLAPSQMKAGLTTALYFTTYEQTLLFLKRRR